MPPKRAADTQAEAGKHTFRFTPGPRGWEVGWLGRLRGQSGPSLAGSGVKGAPRDPPWPQNVFFFGSVIRSEVIYYSLLWMKARRPLWEGTLVKGTHGINIIVHTLALLRSRMNESEERVSSSQVLRLVGVATAQRQEARGTKRNETCTLSPAGVTASDSPRSFPCCTRQGVSATIETWAFWAPERPGSLLWTERAAPHSRHQECSLTKCTRASERLGRAGARARSPGARRLTSCCPAIYKACCLL